MDKRESCQPKKNGAIKLMAKIIGLIQVKGGAGRSTIATNLAGALAAEGKTALIDCDLPQGTSASWFSIREGQDKTQNLTLATAEDAIQLVQQVEALSPSHDFIVIDCPPRIEGTTRAALMLSGICLIPIGASAAEIWATGDVLTIIEAAKKQKPDVDARLIWNRYRSATSSAHELTAAVHKQLGLPELKTKLGMRVAYSDALARGMTVLEWSDKAAKDEFAEMVRETIKILRNR